MQSFSRGWAFLKQAWSMAFMDKDLLKPSVYALIVGMIVSVIGIIPLAGAAFFLSNSQIGFFILFFMGSILAFVQFVVSYIFSGMTVYLIYGYLAEGDGRMDKAWAIVRRDFFDILTLAAASTAVNMLRGLANRNRNRGITGSLISSATGLFQMLWTEAAYLILPAMVIDDLNLKNSMVRILNITRENLLLIGISTVGVRWVTGLISFLFGAVGFVIGFVIGGGMVYISNGNTAVSVIGIAIGALTFFTFVMVASVFSTYTSTAYHTCLYIWARDVETAKAQGSTIKVAAPAPLAAALA